jgi:Xaa-Pro aminopeptidase
VTGQDVDRAARKVIADGGHGPYFTHRTGHGLGLEGHEPPYMVEGNTVPLEAGNTFTIEPGIYVPELGGVRIEDDVLITENGAESLTTADRELRVIG